MAGHRAGPNHKSLELVVRCGLQAMPLGNHITEDLSYPKSSPAVESFTRSSDPGYLYAGVPALPHPCSWPFAGEILGLARSCVHVVPAPS